MAFSQRSFWKGHGRAGYGKFQNRGKPLKAVLPKPDEQQHHLQEVELNSIGHEEKDALRPQIKDVEFVASYNWVDGRDTPTILVPGKPPRWLPPGRCQTLPEDSDNYYRDPNGARYSTYPTLPAIRAILRTDDAFDFTNLDVFGCGNTLGNLLSFVRNEERTFRSGVERIGSVLFFVRKTNTPKEIIEGVHGYGHTFPEAYTIWDRDVTGSASHQRIIKYDFDGLKCVIRSECDGFLPDLPASDGVNAAANGTRQDTTPHADVLLSSLALGSHSDTTSTTLEVQDAGRRIPQRAVFDLKTRSIKTKVIAGDSLDESFYHRLWVNQTPNFILAFHERGTFRTADIHVKNVTAEVGEWEKSNSNTLSKFRLLLQMLIDLSKRGDKGRFEIRRTELGPLEIWSETLEWSALPEDLKERVKEGWKASLGLQEEKDGKS